MLRTNPESTCVVKVDDSEGSAKMGVVEYENKNT
ncbi:hypothetical protein RDI58_022998 [Solanum bulbocastanum]|uniref:Uncharacterized protein n=1 Tax=Solanum bulbocastanum TaxID=147425 RepID=A0AAN8T6S2_SOLBU